MAKYKKNDPSKKGFYLLLKFTCYNFFQLKPKVVL